MCTPTQLHDNGFIWFMIVWCRKNTCCTGVTSVCKEDLRYLMFFMPLSPCMYTNTFYIIFINIFGSFFTSIMKGDLKNCHLEVYNYCWLKVFLTFLYVGGFWQLGSSEILGNSCVNASDISHVKTSVLRGKFNNHILEQDCVLKECRLVKESFFYIYVYVCIYTCTHPHLSV